MAFSTAISWSTAGAQFRTTLMNNLNVADPGAFCLGLNECIRAWSAMKYSQSPPNRTMYPNNGFGSFSWLDGANGQRSQAVQFSFTASEWASGVGVRLNMLSVT